MQKIKKNTPGFVMIIRWIASCIYILLPYWFAGVGPLATFFLLGYLAMLVQFESPNAKLNLSASTNQRREKINKYISRLAVVVWIALCICLFLYYWLYESVWISSGWQSRLGFFSGALIIFLLLSFLAVRAGRIVFFRFASGQEESELPKIKFSSESARRRMETIGKSVSALIVFVWIALCIAVLLLYWYDDGNEAYIGFYLAMAYLSFPSGSLVAAVGGSAVSALAFALAKAGFDPSVYIGRQAVVVATWISMFAAGFIQWFVIVPWVFRRCRKRYFQQNLQG